MSARSTPVYDFSHQELLKNGRVDAEVFEQLRSWLKKDNNNNNNNAIPDLTDQQICLFQLACDNCLNGTKSCIQAYYRIKKAAPELFDNRDPQRPEQRHQLDMLEFCVLPKRTEDNCVIVIHRLFDPKATNYHMEIAMKVLFMTLDAALHAESSPPSGLVMLFDMRHVGLTHLTRMRIGALRLFFSYLQEALPIKLREIHVFNTVWFIDKIFSVIKPLMNAELFQKINLHTSSVDFTELNKKWLPKWALPSDFMGELSCIADFHQLNRRRLLELLPYFQAEERQRKEALEKKEKLKS